MQYLILRLAERRENKMAKKNVAIIVAAGSGSRAGGNLPKQFQEIENKMILVRAIEPFEKASFIDEIILVVSRDYVEYTLDKVVGKHKFKKIKQVIAGGASRFNSVYAGLKAIEDVDLVFVHDGARPFVSSDSLKKVYESAKETKASVLGVPIKCTIKMVDDDMCVETSLNRKKLWEMQTPQVFDAKLLREAYDNAYLYHIPDLTDDAMVVERMTNTPIHIVPGEYSNIKITSKIDIKVGKAYLKQAKS